MIPDLQGSSTTGRALRREARGKLIADCGLKKKKSKSHGTLGVLGSRDCKYDIMTPSLRVRTSGSHL